jgi:simple sugar transport system ATP-binding protein
MSSTPLLSLQGLTKSFPGVRANSDVSFDVGYGEIHALLGENGAGKSTLVKMIYGVLHPDAGRMTLEGEPYSPQKPSEARARGVGMVFQHFSLFEALTVAENVALGISAGLAGPGLEDRITETSRRYGLALEPHRLVGTLSVGERQRIEIVRCLLQEPRLVIMDEPTSVLTPQETDALFETLRRLAGEGRSILYISHKLEEIRALCGKATVLRGGMVVANCDPRRETARSLAEMMIGTSLQSPKRSGKAVGAVKLRIDGLSLKSDEQFGVDLDAISLEVRTGEIVGIAGVAGNGQGELMQALIGERRAGAADAILIDGRAAGLLGPAERRALGMCFVPEERLGHAAAPDMSLTENALLSAAVRMGLVKRGLIDLSASRRYAEKVVERFNVRTAGVSHAARSLSGGNLQKFIIGREILQSPAVLVAAQPTWGVDAGAAALIQQLLIGLADEGAAILVVSQDLDELFQIADRIAVISGGRLSAARPASELSVETIGREMGAGATRRAAHA